MRRLTVAGFMMAVLPWIAPHAGADREPGFDAHWRDGNAEVAGYRYTVERYGRRRDGRAVAIFVTEPFSRTKLVKLDAPERSPSDAVDVLKLNLMRDFQTGIYDYHTSLSLFVRSDDLVPVKLAFSSSEWCGQVYEEIEIRNRRMSRRLSSYFEGESGTEESDVPPGGVQEDALFVLLRGLRGAYLGAGERRVVPFLPSPFLRRLTHARTAWTTASIERLARPEGLTVPAGTFEADVFVVRTAAGRVGRFHLERAHPHRLLKWSWTAAKAGDSAEGSDGAELTGSTRVAYWKAHDPGDERLLPRLGLKPGTR